jgi:hypothetical protein
MTPHELRFLANLRSRGHAPELDVFITDDWDWATRFTEQIGALAIRVSNSRDFEHDWSSLAGLRVYLKLRRAAPADVADFATAVLAANPAKLTTWIGTARHVVVFDADAKVAA